MNDFSCFVNLQESSLLHMQQSHGLLMTIWSKTKPVKKADRNTGIFPLNQMAPNLRSLYGARHPAVPLSDENATWHLLTSLATHELVCSAPQVELCCAGSPHTSLTTGIRIKMDSMPCGSITCWHAGHQNLKPLSGLFQIRCKWWLNHLFILRQWILYLSMCKWSSLHFV